jgi:hypothetical protein
MRRILTPAPLWFLAAIFLSASWSCAEDALAHQRRMENRFLFVIDTSSAMKSRTDGIEEAVNGLLASDMKGELRNGDTIGLWTYGEHLSTDFPMQVWSEGKKDEIINNIREHLHNLVYEKRSHLEKAWPEIHQVVASSERLTVILIFEGTDSIKGTMFDKDINKLHRQYARQFRSAHEPLVTVMAARDGKMFDYTINHPSAVMVPHMADPLPPPEIEAPPPAPIVVSAPPPPQIATPPAHRVEINLSGADFPHSASTPPSAAGNIVPPTPTPAILPAPTPAPAAPVAVQAAQTAPAVNTTVAPPEPAPAPSTVPAPIVTAPAKPVSVARAAPSTPPALASVVPATSATGQPVTMLVIAFSLLIIAVALVVLLVWRGRSRSQPSLISRSIDRPQ